MSDTIAQIQANIESSFVDEKDRASEADQNAASFADTSQEDAQLDQAVSTLDPIEQIKLQREEEALEREQLKEAERQNDRIIRLQQRAAKGDEDAARQLEIEKKKGATATGHAINTATTAFGQAQDQAFKTAEKVRDTAGGAWDWVGRIAIPGSIWLPIAVLLIFFFLLLPVNGHTRAEWLWLTLTGQAHIEGGGTGGGGTVRTAGPTKQFTGISVI
jgi:hypothetical protein